MRGERLKSVIKLHKRFWLLQFFLRDLLSVLKLLDSCKSTFMLVYDLEFDQIKDCLSSLNGYSDANIKLLEILLNRYEDVILRFRGGIPPARNRTRPCFINESAF